MPDTAASPRTPAGHRLPNLVLAGVTKAGTTSLVRYLAQHPDVFAGPTKGTHHFTRLRYGPAALPPIEQYARPFAEQDATYLLDGSISYFTGGEPLVRALCAALPGARVLISVRDPVDRLWSTYKMKRTRGALPHGMRFRGYVEACELVHTEGRVTPETEVFRALETGLYGHRMPMWWSAFGPSLRVLFFDDLATDPQAALSGLCRWLQVDTAVAGSFDYSIRNRTVQHRNRTLRRAVDGGRRLGGRELQQRPRLAAALRRAYRTLNTHEFEETMDDATRRHLGSFYRESNERFAAQLRSRGYDELPPWLSRHEKTVNRSPR